MKILLINDSAPGLAADTAEQSVPQNRAEFLQRLNLPDTTTDAELAVVLQAGDGDALPTPAAAFTALLAFTMRERAIAEPEARRIVAQKFPALTPPTGSSPAATVAAGSLREQLIALYQLPATASDEDISAAAAAVQKQNAADKARREHEAADELLIESKTKVGLTRAQAVGVIERQRNFDAVTAQQCAERLPVLLELIGRCPSDFRAARRLCREEFAFLDGGEFEAALAAFKKAQAIA